MPRDRIVELLGFRPEAQKNNIEQDRYDKATYGDLLKASLELQQLVDERGGTWPALIQDIWAGFYKAAPELADEGNVDMVHRANRPIIEKFLSDPATEQARVTTMLDELGSALATLGAGRKLLEEIKNRPELKKAMELAREAAEEKVGGKRGQEQSQQAGEKGEKIENAKRIMEQHARDMRRAVREAIEAGQQEANEAQQILAGWGIEPGDLKHVPMEQKLDMVRRLSEPRMKSLADLIGRFRNLARARQKQKVKKERDEIHSITQGNDLEHVLPPELAALRHPVRKLDFYKKYTERGLAQYDLRAKRPQGRGPIIALIDASGSMGGSRMDWAVAVALGLLDTALRQKRRMAVVFFNTNVQKEILFDGRDIEKMIELATVGTDGGTDYRPALLRGLELLQQDGYQRGDIVLITDGNCMLDDESRQAFLTEKERLGFRVWSVLIGAGYGDVQKWSDRVWDVYELTEETAGEIFEGVY